MPTPAITNGEEQFFVTTYEGTGTGQKVGKFVPFTDNATIDNSCIFDAASNAGLTRTPSGAGNRRTFTVSVWAKRCVLGDQSGSNTYGQRIFNAGTSGNFFDIKWSGSGDTEGANRLHIREYSGSAEQIEYWTNRTFEDTSKWFHILLQVDTTQSTSTDRIKLYIDGDQVTSWYRSNAPSLNFDTQVNSTVSQNIGRFLAATSNNLDGYLAEFNLVDGSIVAPSTFGLTDSSTGRWIPKTLTGITYGTNGFRLKFQDSSVLGDDSSGNNNDFTAANLASTDPTTDSPTQNFPTFSMAGPYIGNLQSAQEGNLKIVMTSGTGYPAVRTLKEIPQSGKWYWEVKAEQVGANQSISNASYGVLDLNIIDVNGLNVSKPFTRQIGGMGLEMYSGAIFTGLLTSAGGSATDFTIGSTGMGDDDYIVFAFDMDNGKAWWGWNDSSAGSSVVWFANDGGTDGDPGAGTNPTVTFNPSSHRFVPTQGGYAPGAGYSANFIFNFGSKPFAFTAPTGFSGLSQNNFPETDKGKPDFVWIKNRDATDSHQLYDSSRGPLKSLTSHTTATEATVTDGLQKFLKGGSAVEDDVKVNSVGESYVSWNWVSNGGTTTANTSATPTIASTIQANPTAGFSIVTYTGTGSAGTVEHGLSTAPEWVIVKSRSNDTGDTFSVYHVGMTSASYYLRLGGTNAEASASTVWNATAPTSSVFSVGTATGTNTNTYTYVAYCWHSVKGFSRFGSYTGNGNANGPFIYTGFKPSWVMVKRTNTTGSWIMWDTKRDEINPMYHRLYANLTNAQGTSGADIDFLSNGFKHRRTDSDQNANGSKYVYMAFAEHPFIGDGTSPATAR